MKLKITRVETYVVPDSVYQEWLDDNVGEEHKNFNDMNRDEQIKVIRECEDECGYEVLNGEAALDSEVTIELV